MICIGSQTEEFLGEFRITILSSEEKYGRGAQYEK
jgi:hypothetical protein